MKTDYLKIDRLIPSLGIALVAAGVIAGVTYVGLERKIESGQAFAATLDRLYHDQKLSSVLKGLHEGEVDAAARRLDVMLCDDILALNSQLASADIQQRAYTLELFVRIAQLRPKNAESSVGSTEELNNDQIEAERILKEACLAIRPPVQDGVASR